MTKPKFESAINVAEASLQAHSAAKRIRDLENLVSVYDATIYCMLPFYNHSDSRQIMDSQVEACRQAHYQIMGESPMFVGHIKPVDK
jgi:hypothetical protein